MKYTLDQMFLFAMQELLGNGFTPAPTLEMARNARLNGHDVESAVHACRMGKLYQLVFAAN